MISCLQEDAQATESYYKWQIARRYLLTSKYDAAQSLGCDVHRTMAGSSFYCGPPSGWKVVARHRLVLRKHWQSWKKCWMSLGSWLVRSKALAQEENLESKILLSALCWCWDWDVDGESRAKKSSAGLANHASHALTWSFHSTPFLFLSSACSLGYKREWCKQVEHGLLGSVHLN